MPSNVDLIWMAGFVDGEGYIGLRKQKHKDNVVGFTFVVTFQIGQVKREPLDIFKSQFGGSIYFRPAYRANDRDAFQWMIESLRAGLALERLIPYLRLKAQQARLALEAQNILSSRKGGQHEIGTHGSTPNPYPARLYEIYEELRRLNKRGRN